jgi:hypothetical protein
MIKHWIPTTAVLTVGALAAAGGVAVAQSGGTPGHHHSTRAHSTQAAEPLGGTSGSDADNLQSGDQSAPDAQSSASQEQSASEQPGTEQASEQQASDGPGGHADEPGSPSAEHQFEGEE